MTENVNLFAGVRNWIVSAWWPEQRVLAEHMSREDPARTSTFSFESLMTLSGFKGSLRDVDATTEKTDPILRIVGSTAFLCTGIGTPQTSISLSTALVLAQRWRACSDAIYFVATAGSYSKNTPINTAHLVKSALWGDGDLAQGRAYLPTVKKFDSKIATRISECVEQKEAMRVLSTPGITLDTELARVLGDSADLENLEIFGVAQVAHAFGIPWAACLGVSNQVGPLAHEEWKQHHASASLAAQELLVHAFPKEFQT